MIELDEILEKCGDWGRLQAMMLILFCIINFMSALHYFSQTIITFVPTFWCADNISLQFITEKTAVPVLHTCRLPDFEENQLCQKYDYDLYMGYESLTSELEWVCDSAWKLAFGQSFFFVGAAVGCMLFGYLADIIGRVPILVVSNLVAMLGNLLTIFGTTLPTFTAFRFVSGLATDSNFVMMYILVMEYVRPSRRTVALSICIGVFYCLGSMLGPWIAVIAHTWRNYLLYTSLPLLVVLLYYCIVPESVQWQISKKKYDKAMSTLKSVAKFNSRVVPDQDFSEFIEKCRQMHAKDENRPNLRGLFATPRLRRHTMMLFFRSMVIMLCYDAVSRNVHGLGISPFVMFTVGASTILPACLVLIFWQDHIGRKAMTSVSLFASGIVMAVLSAVLFIKFEEELLIIVLFVIARFGVVVAYNSSSQHAAEMIPTCVRGQGVGAVHVAGFAFTFLSAYILHTRLWFPPMPEIILGVLSILGAVLSLLLPETLNRTLPTTLADGENF